MPNEHYVTLIRKIVLLLQIEKDKKQQNYESSIRPFGSIVSIGHAGDGTEEFRA